MIHQEKPVISSAMTPGGDGRAGGGVSTFLFNHLKFKDNKFKLD
jgi:hypothetical protein